MDIRQWLQETTDRVPPVHPDTPTVPDFIRPQPENQNRQSHVRRGKRKRASSDSSLIRPRRGWNGSEAADHRPAAHKLQSAAAAGLDDRSTSRASSRVNHRTYERRPRHKTKPDRYEPKHNRKRKDRELKHTDRRTRKRRKSHRHDDDYQGPPVLLQSLVSKNGGKNGRLTLKPDTHTGLFKHGRAGERVAGRGIGLPDLVFNELKFLQKPAEHQDEPIRADTPPRGKRNERMRVQDEQISAYFNANNGTKSQLPEEIVRQREESQRPRRNRDLEEAQPARHSAKQIESMGKASLEAGSHAADATRRPDQSESAEHYPWSGSVVNHSTKARTQPGEAIKRRQSREHRSSLPHHSAHFDSSRSRSHGPQTGVLDGVLNGKRTAEAESVEPSMSGPGKPTALPRDERCLYIPASMNTVRSRPRDASQQREAEQDELRKAADRLHLPRDFQTSDILEIRKPRDHSGETESCGRVGMVAHAENDKENASPGSSVDELLCQARDAIFRPVSVPQSHLRGASTPRERLSGRSAQGQTDFEAQMTDRIKQPRARQMPEHFNWASPDRSRIDHRSVRDMPTAGFEHSRALDQIDVDVATPEAATFELALPFDNEMLDNGSLVDDNPCQDGYADLQNRRADEVVRRVFAVPETRLFEKQAEQMWGEEEMCPREWSDVGDSEGWTDAPSTYERSGEASLERQDETMETMAGFWKPHKLY